MSSTILDIQLTLQAINQAKAVIQDAIRDNTRLNDSGGATSKIAKEAAEAQQEHASSVNALAIAATAGVAAMSAFGAAMAAVFSRGADFNSQLEDARLGIAAVGRAMAPQTYRDFDAALAGADEALRALQEKARTSPATFQQLTSAFVAVSGAASGAGIGMGQQVELVASLTQAIKGLGLPMEQITQEIRAILTGNINVDAQAARTLGITAEAIKQNKEAGTLFDFLMNKVRAFTEAGERGAGNMSTQIGNVKDNLDQLAGTISKPAFEVFKRFLENINATMSSPEFAKNFEDLSQAMMRIAQWMAQVGVEGINSIGMLANYTTRVLELGVALASLLGIRFAILKLVELFPGLVGAATAFATALSLGDTVTICWSLKTALTGVYLTMLATVGVATGLAAYFVLLVTWAKALYEYWGKIKAEMQEAASMKAMDSTMRSWADRTRANLDELVRTGAITQEVYNSLIKKLEFTQRAIAMGLLDTNAMYDHLKEIAEEARKGIEDKAASLKPKPFTGYTQTEADIKAEFEARKALEDAKFGQREAESRLRAVEFRQGEVQEIERQMALEEERYNTQKRMLGEALNMAKDNAEAIQLEGQAEVALVGHQTKRIQLLAQLTEARRKEAEENRKNLEAEINLELAKAEARQRAIETKPGATEDEKAAAMARYANEAIPLFERLNAIANDIATSGDASKEEKLAAERTLLDLAQKRLTVEQSVLKATQDAAKASRERRAAENALAVSTIQGKMEYSQASPYSSQYEKDKLRLQYQAELLPLIDKEIAAQKENASLATASNQDKIAAQEKILALTRQKQQIEDEQRNTQPTQFGRTDRIISGGFRTNAQGGRELVAPYEALDNFLANTLQATMDGLSDSITGLITGTRTWAQVWTQVGNMIIGYIVRMVLEYTVFHAIRMALDSIFHTTAKANIVSTAAVAEAAKATSTATSASQAATVAAASAPAAAATSIYSWGSSSIVGLVLALAAIAAITAALAGAFEEGGYTGPGGRSQVAGIVHAGEFVIPKPVVDRLGVEHFDAYMRGSVPVVQASGIPRGYANGGFVSAPPAAAGKQAVNIAFLDGRNEEREFMRKEGFKAVVDAMARRGNKVNL